jgi:hypothetical protein
LISISLAVNYLLRPEVHVLGIAQQGM